MTAIPVFSSHTRLIYYGKYQRLMNNKSPKSKRK